MEDIKKENISDFILKRINRLNLEKVYTYAVLGNIGPKERVLISRLADRGEIVKAGRGKFFKPSKSIYKESDTVITIDKTMFTHDLFWSVGDGAKVNVVTLIIKYIESPQMKNIAALYHLFGYKRVLSTSLKHFKNRNSEQYTQVRNALEKCAKWRLDDNRS